MIKPSVYSQDEHDLITEARNNSGLNKMEVYFSLVRDSLGCKQSRDGMEAAL